jgi:hypothetical protein
VRKNKAHLTNAINDKANFFSTLFTLVSCKESQLVFFFSKPLLPQEIPKKDCQYKKMKKKKWNWEQKAVHLDSALEWSQLMCGFGNSLEYFQNLCFVSREGLIAHALH